MIQIKLEKRTPEEREAYMQGYNAGLRAAEAAMDDLEKEDIEAYGCKIAEGFDAERAKEKIRAIGPNISETLKEDGKEAAE